MRVAKMRGIKTVAAALFLLLAASGVAMAQVSVWAEGAYTATDLAVYIYANTGGDTGLDIRYLVANQNRIL